VDFFMGGLPPGGPPGLGGGGPPFPLAI
jgi:hypothetical protein